MKNILFCVLTLSVAFSPVCLSKEETDPLTSLIKENSYSIGYSDSRFTGDGVNWLLEKAKESQFFMVGEEHGIAENPMLVAQLYEDLRASGYSHLVIEVSPQMANYLEEAIQLGGVDELERRFAPGVEPAFFGMAEEAIMLARVVNATDSGNTLIGVDYEVAGDKVLLDQLESLPKPEEASIHLRALRDASDAAWKQYLETNGPQFIFSFSTDPQLVRNVIDAWPNPPASVSRVLNTLHQTLSINQFWIEGKGWESNFHRANLFRSNFVNFWQEHGSSSKKVMFKLGASHLMRGLNANKTFDLGNLVPEVAALNGTKSFSIMVLPGADSPVAVLDPTVWEYRSAAPKDGYTKGLAEFYDAVKSDGFTVFDLAPIKATLYSRDYASEEYRPLRDLVTRFDALLIMTGSTASKQLPKATLSQVK